MLIVNKVVLTIRVLHCLITVSHVLENVRRIGICHVKIILFAITITRNCSFLAKFIRQVLCSIYKIYDIFSILYMNCDSWFFVNLDFFCCYTLTYFDYEHTCYITVFLSRHIYMSIITLNTFRNAKNWRLLMRKCINDPLKKLRSHLCLVNWLLALLAK